MRGWRRSRLFDSLGLHWVYPSPNMPTWETALVYPGMVLLEGTNISEGRGTTMPFQLFGAPFLDQKQFLLELKGARLEGVTLRPVSYEPAFDKYKGQACFGFQLHITDKNRFRPYRMGLALLQALRRTHPDRFSWLDPPYEYEWKKLPIDILIGSDAVRRRVEQRRGPRPDRVRLGTEIANFGKSANTACFTHRKWDHKLKTVVLGRSAGDHGSSTSRYDTAARHFWGGGDCRR